MGKFSAIREDSPVLLIGCGKMGSAMLSGWLKRKLDRKAIYIVDPYLDSVKATFGEIPQSNLHESLDNLPAGLKPSFVIVAVKPQIMDEVITALKQSPISGDVLVSVAAGKPIRYFEDHLGREQAIIRAMPNTPASIGRGVTVCCANRPVSQEQKGLCSMLLQTVGSIEWIDDENLMDAVTALSGSGPPIYLQWLRPWLRLVNLSVFRLT